MHVDVTLRCPPCKARLIERLDTDDFELARRFIEVAARRLGGLHPHAYATVTVYQDSGRTMTIWERATRPLADPAD